MFKFILVLFFCLLVNCEILPMVKIAQKNDYPIETHKINTEDGYVLTLFRLPNENGKPILLTESLALSSEDWIVLGTNQSLAFLLYNEGYDVWLSNSRGNYYSRSHKILKPNEEKFWDYTLDELGTRDLPSVIDYILNKINKSRLFFIGHGSGSAQLLILNSEKPEYNQKVEASILLGPYAYLKYMTPGYASTFANLANYWPFKGKSFEFTPRNGPFNKYLNIACNPKYSYLYPFCVKNIYPDYFKNIKKESFQKIVKGYPSGSSIKPFYHLLQLYKASGVHFRKYDYGNKNIEMYGSNIPPEYNIKQTTSPVFIIYGDDEIANKQNVNKLIEMLPNVTKNIFIKNYSNIDLIWGDNVQFKVNEKIIEWLKDTLNKE